MRPTISCDHEATKRNRWNVRLGLVVAKTTSIAGHPVKFQFGVEYSVVSQGDFGQRFPIKLNIIPVVPPLIKKALYGGVTGSDRETALLTAFRRAAGGSE